MFVLKQIHIVLFFVIVKGVKIHKKIKKRETNCFNQLFKKIETWNFFQDTQNLLIKLAVNAQKVNVNRNIVIVLKMVFLVVNYAIAKIVKI